MALTAYKTKKSFTKTGDIDFVLWLWEHEIFEVITPIIVTFRADHHFYSTRTPQIIEFGTTNSA